MSPSFSLLTVLVSFSQAPPADPPVVRSLSFSPDGALLAGGVSDKAAGGRVLIWDVSARKLVGKHERAGDSPVAAFAPDGKALVVAGGQKSLTVLDPNSGKKSGELGPLPAEAVGLQPAGPGKWVILGKDQTFRVWDEKEKKVAREFAGFKRVWGWAVSPGGKWLF